AQPTIDLEKLFAQLKAMEDRLAAIETVASNGERGLGRIEEGGKKAATQLENLSHVAQKVSSQLANFGIGAKTGIIVSGLADVGAELLQLHRQVGQVDAAFEAIHAGGFDKVNE